MLHQLRPVCLLIEHENEYGHINFEENLKMYLGLVFNIPILMSKDDVTQYRS